MTDKLYTRFVQNVRGVMQMKGLTQTDVAARMDCTPAYVSQILSGHRHPTLETVERVAKALRVDPEKLFSEKREDVVDIAC